MKIAIPTANGKLSMHFGHCEKFTVLEVDPVTNSIIAEAELDAPPHEPGLLPPWLAKRGVDMIIAGGMGQRAQMLFEAQNITVLTGASGELTPTEVVTAYLNKTLQTGANACDH
ncbi:NifB/NifX family molybdenum-iron cluster-binding protein [Pontiellaceae bacterium B12227]|nr:NifB/NifX family molybdenum-iron cluster-binding protein [Pontiellaceae bacterium B12227]